MWGEKDEGILFLNPKFVEIIGYSPQEAHSLPEFCRLAFPCPPYRREMMKELSRSLNPVQAGGRETPPLAARVTCRNGVIRQFEITFVKSGPNVILMFADQTEKLEAQNALRRQRAYNRILFEAIPIGLALSRLDGTLLDLNIAFSRIFGFTVAEIKGMNYDDMTPAEYLENEVRPKEYLLKNGRVGPYEKEYFHKDGHRVPVRLHAQIIEFEGKKYVWTSIEDITEQRKNNEQLIQSQKLQSIGTLAGGISHEINNLLTPIIGLTELVIDDISDRQHLENLTGVLEAAERAKQMLGQVLAFSHKSEPRRKAEWLGPIIAKAIALLRIGLPGEVKLSLDIKTELQVEVDAAQIQQVILNLCTNAAQALGPKGGTLDISIARQKTSRAFYRQHPNLRPEKYAVIMIGDSGSGMDEITLSRVFEPFFTTKKVGEGTGMGLSVAHGIIENHGGAIEFESAVGKGTVAKVYLAIA